MAIRQMTCRLSLYSVQSETELTDNYNKLKYSTINTIKCTRPTCSRQTSCSLDWQRVSVSCCTCITAPNRQTQQPTPQLSPAVKHVSAPLVQAKTEPIQVLPRVSVPKRLTSSPKHHGH